MNMDIFAIAILLFLSSSCGPGTDTSLENSRPSSAATPTESQSGPTTGAVNMDAIKELDVSFQFGTDGTVIIQNLAAKQQ
jgi:hypothetical protein